MTTCRTSNLPVDALLATRVRNAQPALWSNSARQAHARRSAARTRAEPLVWMIRKRRPNAWHVLPGCWRMCSPSWPPQVVWWSPPCCLLRRWRPHWACPTTKAACSSRPTTACRWRAPSRPGAACTRCWSLPRGWHCSTAWCSPAVTTAHWPAPAGARGAGPLPGGGGLHGQPGHEHWRGGVGPGFSGHGAHVGRCQGMEERPPAPAWRVGGGTHGRLRARRGCGPRRGGQQPAVPLCGRRAIVLAAAGLQRGGAAPAKAAGRAGRGGGCRTPAHRLPALWGGWRASGHHLRPAAGVGAACALFFCRAGAVAVLFGANDGRAGRAPLGVRLGADQPHRGRWPGRAACIPAGRRADAAAAVGRVHCRR